MNSLSEEHSQQLDVILESFGTRINLSSSSHDGDFTNTERTVIGEDDWVNTESYEVLESFDDIVPPSTINTATHFQAIEDNKKEGVETCLIQLLKQGLSKESAKKLRDERFIKERIEKLDIKHAAKVHVADLELFEEVKIEREENEEKKKRHSAESMRNSFANSNTASRRTLASSSRVLDVCPLLSAKKEVENLMLDSLDLFLASVMELCGTCLHKDVFEVKNDSCKSLLLGEDNKQKTVNKSKVSFVDGGISLLILGRFLFKKELFNEALRFFHHALYLLLLDAGLNEPSLLKEEENVHNLFYVNMAAKVCKDTATNHKRLAIVMARAGDSYGKMNCLDDAIDAYNASISFLKSHLALNNAESEQECRSNDEIASNPIELMAFVHNQLGAVFMSNEDSLAAIKTLQELLAMKITNNIDNARAFHNIGVCHRHLGNLNKALEYYTKAHQIHENILGKNHLDTVRTLHNIGGIYRRKNRYVEALKCFQEVLKVRRKNSWR